MLNLDTLKETYPDIPLNVWEILKNLDAYTYNHSIRVCEICQLVEKEMGFKDKILSEAGLLHDIGKYFYSQVILGKHGGLNSLERELIDLHSFLSYYILKHYNLPSDICEIALYHHKLSPVFFKTDCTKCDDKRIEKLAGVLKTIDIFEALTTDRPYHRGLSRNTAISNLGGCDKETIEILSKADILGRD